MIFRCKYSKLGDISFISHLDLLRIFIRAMRREEIRINYSQGYHPHPKISFSSALSLGVESQEEIMDIDVDEETTAQNIMNRLNHGLPMGIRIIECQQIEKAGSIPSLITHSLYEFIFDSMDEEMDQALEKILALEEILINKKNKKGVVSQINVRERIAELYRKGNSIFALILNSSNGAMKPAELLEIVKDTANTDRMPTRIIKLKSVFYDGANYHEI